ncbi:MAG TPA: restriction endonuclease [Phycisphaerales bacterium]|nr:restriction endonuclease [Phycisphaerales bacterium]
MRSARSYEDLKREAVLWWPDSLIEREQNASIIPRLIETQSKFISVLHVADGSPDGWKTVLRETANLSANLFLKHLVVLADFGGELLKRVKPVLKANLADRTLRYVWCGRVTEYTFQSLEEPGLWSNPLLYLDAKGMLAGRELTEAMEDVCMLILHGGATVQPGIPAVVLERCIIGSMIGKRAELNKFVRQRYIWVSRITGGASANRLGHLAEDFVREQLGILLPRWDFSSKRIDGITQNDGRTDMTFDIVAESPSGKYCAIEVSFQVTTNSTIERKQGQAQARQSALHDAGHAIAYVIDGVGNFERQAALSTICQFSDCTVTFRQNELERLATFLQELDA